MNELARALLDAGQYDQALGLVQQTLEIRRKTLGAEHPDTLDAINVLALVYVAQDKCGREPLHSQFLESTGACWVRTPRYTLRNAQPGPRLL